jgi:hypothetical protein
MNGNVYGDKYGVLSISVTENQLHDLFMPRLLPPPPRFHVSEITTSTGDTSCLLVWKFVAEPRVGIETTVKVKEGRGTE